MPFAGELLQVRDDERDWEGAAERLLRNFGLSLLVPDEHYAQVAEWVDSTHLRGRLVYFRVRQSSRGELPDLHRDSLVRKLAIKPDSPFYDWLERELAHRFDVACCATQEQFRRETRAITRAGQIKAPGERHEKDDRHRLDDRSRYVLGWTNAAKIAALEAKARQLEARLGELGSLIGKIQAEQRRAQGAPRRRCRSSTSTPISANSTGSRWPWKWRSWTDEKQRLESASDVLKQLTEQLNEVADGIERHGSAAGRAQGQALQSRAEEERCRSLARCRRKRCWMSRPMPLTPRTSSGSTPCASEALGEHQLTVESCDNREQDMRDWLQTRIDAEDQKAQAPARQDHPGDGGVQGSIQAGNRRGRCQHRSGLRIPEHARSAAGRRPAALRGALQGAAQREHHPRGRELPVAAGPRAGNDQGAHRAHQRVAHPDRLQPRPLYRAGSAADAGCRYPRLPDRAARLHRRGADRLRRCPVFRSQVPAGQAHHRALPRPRGLSEQDRRWTAKVTDVRNWFVFAASERWREDDSEHEHYSDSGGKSGGQKEKLAYTILAASLAYQFGLEWGAVRSRSFRFVVIDEAFGRGSDESAQYGLRLFAQLNLQLLIVTPLQKIHIIEPFVSSVGFVHNEDGRASKLRNLSIEEYRAEKARIAG